MSAVLQEKPKREVILNPQRIQLATYWRHDWVVKAEEGTSIADVLDPVYWAHKSAEFTAYDRIEVRLETGEWMIELMVVEAGRNWAKVKLLQEYHLSAEDKAEAASIKHKVFWRGDFHKFAVKRLSDNEVLQSGMTKEAANAWLIEYEKTVAT